MKKILTWTCHFILLQNTVISNNKSNQTNQLWNAIRWNDFLGHEKVVDILLQNGAEYDEKDKDGNSPLYWAIWEGDWLFSIIWIVVVRISNYLESFFSKTSRNVY